MLPSVVTTVFLTACILACSAEDPAITAAREANAAYPFEDLASAVLAYSEHVTTILNKKMELGQIVKVDDGSGGKWPETHDVIYEMVNLLSAPGGKSTVLMDHSFKKFIPRRPAMHGGFVEYYTRLLCAARGIPQSAPQYPFHYSFVASFCPKFPGLCWRIFMQNESFNILGKPAAKLWNLGNEHCEHTTYTMGVPEYDYIGSITTLYTQAYYGPHIQKGWCLAVGDRENGICHPQCEKQCYTLSEDQSVHPCFKYCAVSTDGPVHKNHDEL